MDSFDEKAMSVEDGERAWEALAERLEQFSAAWESAAEPPALSEYLEAIPAALRRLLLVELIKVDLEQRWQKQLAPQTVEYYLKEFPALADGGRLPPDLIFEEYHVRLRHGDAVSPADYERRFPKQVAELRAFWKLDDVGASMSLGLPRRPVKLHAGESLDDFDLLTELGQGAFATVFLARQRSLQRIVALKISSDQGLETQTLAQLDHPHIVRVYDQRRLPDRNLRLMYMQYVPGGTLQEALVELRRLPRREWNGRTWLAAVDRALERRGESPPVNSAVRRRLERASWPVVVCWVGAQLAAALEYAHQNGVLHRDVKPGNVLLTGESAGKLVDFNISYCNTVDGAAPAAYFGGSLAYMSPEQLEAFHPRHERTADSLDERSDLYSLGVVLWELLTGERPFADERRVEDWSETLDEMLVRRQTGVTPQEIDDVNRQLPGLGTVLSRLLAPRIEQRFGSGHEVSRQLQLCALPDAQRLVRADDSGWRRWVRAWPLTTVILVSLLPNAAAGAFNLYYNYSQIIEKLPNAQPTFMTVQAVINGLAFPLGVVVGLALAWTVARAVRGASPLTPDREVAVRRHCLRLGHYIALLGIVEWLVAGPAFPLALWASGVALTTGDAFHFMVSLTLCGMIAAAYPFFGVTLLSVRVFYPRLLGDAVNLEDATPGIKRLERLSFLYLGLAAAVPLLGVALLVTLGSAHRVSLALVSVGGLLGLVGLFGIARLVQRDLTTLSRILQIPAAAPELVIDEEQV